MNDHLETSSLNDAPLTAPMPGLPNPEPTESSSLDELATYGLLKQGQIIARDRANAQDMWLMGRALRWAKAKVPHGSWEEWLRAKKFKKTWAWKARTLSEATTLDKVKNLGLTEALVRFGIDKPKPAQVKDQPKRNAKNEADTVQKTTTQPDTEESQLEQDEAPDDGTKGLELGEGPESEEDGPLNEEGPDEDLHDGPSDQGVDDEEDKDFKEYQAALRRQTPLSRAVAIRNALELILEDVIGESVEVELQDTFGQIAELAEALRGLNDRDDEQAPTLRLRGRNESLAG